MNEDRVSSNYGKSSRKSRVSKKTNPESIAASLYQRSSNEAIKELRVQAPGKQIKSLLSDKNFVLCMFASVMVL